MRLQMLLLLLLATVTGHAQTWQKRDAGIKTIINKTVVEIQFYSTSTVRVIKSPEGVAFDKKSLSVIAAPKQLRLNIEERAGVVTLKSEKVLVRCNLTSGTLSFYDNAGKAL